MFRRLLPALLALVFFLLDTTIAPMIYAGVYAVPLSAVLVFCIGIVLGRMRGLLYGTLTGLLIDITTGTLGMMTFFFMAIGFMIGLILGAPGERVVSSRRKRRRRLVRQAVWVFALFAAGEVVLFVIQYFNTATFQWVYILNILIRSAICMALTMAARPLMERVLEPRGSAKSAPRTREVKSF